MKIAVDVAVVLFGVEWDGFEPCTSECLTLISDHGGCSWSENC